MSYKHLKVFLKYKKEHYDFCMINKLVDKCLLENCNISTLHLR